MTIQQCEGVPHLVSSEMQSVAAHKYSNQFSSSAVAMPADARGTELEPVAKFHQNVETLGGSSVGAADADAGVIAGVGAANADAVTGSRFLSSERFAVAPMVDVTDSIFRQIARIMSKRCMLYTEMIAAEALVHDKLYLIQYKEQELPCCLQLGGNDPARLAIAVKRGVEAGFTSINLNAGCPSDKVQNGCFGAILMRTPQVIGDCFKAMQEAAQDVPVSVKTRIGVDELDSEEFTFKLMDAIYQAGCRHIIIHARKAWLNGLSPKENRTVPPLDYERVYKIKSAYPDLAITINGGITSIEQCKRQLSKVDGVMLGRAVIDTPYILAQVDHELFGESALPLSREEVLAQLLELAAKLQAEGRPLHLMIRHVLGLFSGCPNARLFRRYLSEHMTSKNATPQMLEQAYKVMLKGVW